MLGTRLPQQIFCITYRRCINRTNFLQCIQKVHRPHTISLQASNPVSTHEFLTSSWGAGCCGMWATQETYLLYVNNMTSITQVMITRLPVAQRVFHTHFAKTIRIPRHHRIALKGNSHSENDNSLYSQFSDDLSEYLGIEPEYRQSKSRKHKLPIAGFSSVRYNVTDANN
jgi:hypothetical protein